MIEKLDSSKLIIHITVLGIELAGFIVFKSIFHQPLHFQVELLSFDVI